MSGRLDAKHMLKLCSMKIFSLLCLVIAHTPAYADEFASRLTEAALERTNHTVIYNGSYRQIPYPGGDVPAHIGVCTDVLVRSYRTVGIDLQELVHEDMKAAFSAYPKIWGLSRPDSNIDHRRVPNLETFFTRNGVSLPLSDDPTEYLPGDIVSWRLPGGQPHIGIVTDQIARSGAPMIVHNIGFGPKLDDILFEYEMKGHFRFGE